MPSRRKVFDMFGGKCAYCGCDLDENSFHIDHIVPVKAGGKKDNDNVFPSCPDCNNFKCGRTNPEWLEWMQGFDMTWTGLIPTPIRSTYKGAPNARYVGGPEYRHALHELVETSPAGIIGKLSPMWTEWLMGYPIGQTELNASETQ